MKTSPLFTRGALLLAAATLLPTLAHAHVGTGDTHGFSHGFTHPLGGLDHLLAMIAVGLWAAQMGGRALWAVPLSFVSVMVLGGALGMAHIEIPFVEQGILISVLVLGVLIAASVRLPVVASSVIVGLFAIFHGFAHGAEMPASTSGVEYALGFVIATALLHSVGIGLGIASQKLSQPLVVRLAGAAIVVCGVFLWVA